MRTLDERLEFAADEARRAVAQVPARRVSAGSRARRAGVRVAQVVALTALVVAVIGGGAILLNGEREVASGGAEFPQLSLRTEAVGNDIALVFAEDATTAPQPVPADDLKVFGDPADLGLSRIFVVTDTDGSDFFRGEVFNDPGWAAVPVPEGVAYLHEEGLTSTILWQVGSNDRLVILVQGLGLDRDTARAVLDGISLGETDVVVGTLPEGFIELYAGPVRYEGERVVMLAWVTTTDATPSAEITLWLHGGADASAERGLYMWGYESAPSITETEVLGRRALRVEMQDGTAFQWLHSPNVYARLLVQGSVDPDEVAGALHEVDAATWGQMFETEFPSDPASTGTTVAPTTTVP